jgi:hypothetical protein
MELPSCSILRISTCSRTWRRSPGSCWSGPDLRWICNLWTGRPGSRGAPRKTRLTLTAGMGFLRQHLVRNCWIRAISSWLTSNCDKALPGWPCEAQLEALSGQFARQLDPIKQQAVARAVQVRATGHPYVPLGQWYSLVMGEIQYRRLAHYAYDRVLEHRKKLKAWSKAEPHAIQIR